MAMQQQAQRDQHQGKPTDKDCMGKNAPTNKSIKSMKDTYCSTLEGLLGDLSQAEENFSGLQTAFEQKKCVFVKTEKNYRVFRNLELGVGIELLQANEEIKKNAATYVTDNTNLAKALSNVKDAAKAAKAKFADLLEYAHKLDACSNDSCNATQMHILTGRKYENCEGKKPPEPGNRPSDCDDAGEIFDRLVSVPESLYKDIGVIFNSSYEIVGIQTFTNIAGLATLQGNVYTNSQAFEGWIKDRMTNGGTSVITAQTDLTTAIKALTTAGYVLYNKRVEVDAVNGTKDYLCCTECDCVKEDCEDDSDRLKECKCEICDICTEVTQIYCREEEQHHHVEHARAR